MKRRHLKRYRLNRVPGRIPRRVPGPTGKYIKLLLALSPYLIDALTCLQHRHRRHLPTKADSWRKIFADRLPGNGRQPK